MLCFGGQAQAGGGPENVALIVNIRSWASTTIALNYASLRQIPASNIVYIDWPYSTEKTDVQTFRTVILGQISSALAANHLSDQIDYIVYSSDFPSAIDFKADTGGVDRGPLATPLGSITSMTFASQQLARGDYRFINLRGNHYGRWETEKNPLIQSVAFRAWHGYAEDGRVIEGGGDHYFLSSMLGVTADYGNSVEEVLSYLRRSTTADGTHPKGTIYYCKNGDVRSTTRDPGFPAAVAELKKLGVNAEIVNGILPQNKKDVQGLVIGTPAFDWRSSKSTILAGAYCDNFTSFGGIFTDHNQTRLSEFLRAGAAGASGMVVEPRAVPEKFPHPFTQVHYARGCTLAEAYYQGVFCPFQLLLVGDPLCRPWANIPRITVDGVTADAVIGGTATLTPHGNVAGGTVDRFEVFVNGVRTGACPAGETVTLDTTAFPDGAAELRVVGIEAGPIASQGRLILPIMIDNHSRSITFTAGEGQNPVVRWRTPMKISASSPGATKIAIFEGSRAIHVFEGESGATTYQPEKLATGPVTLQAKALGPDNKVTVVSPPIKLTVDSYTPLPGRKTRPGARPMAPGLQFLAEGGSKLVIPRTNDGKWLKDTKTEKDQKFTMAAIFRIPTEGIYQFQIKHVGPAMIKIDGTPIYNGDQKTPNVNFAPVALGAGLHEFRMTGKGDQPSGFEIRFGGPGSQHLDGKLFQHPG